MIPKSVFPVKEKSRVADAAYPVAASLMPEGYLTYKKRNG